MCSDVPTVTENGSGGFSVAALAGVGWNNGGHYCADSDSHSVDCDFLEEE